MSETYLVLLLLRRCPCKLPLKVSLAVLHLQGNSACSFRVEQVVEHNRGVCIVVVIAAIDASAFSRRYFTSVTCVLVLLVRGERRDDAQRGVEQPLRVLVEFSDEREGTSLSPSSHCDIPFVSCLF